MSTTPRIPQELVEGFFMQSEDDGSPAAAVAIPIELSRLAAIPVRTKRSFQLDPVLHELIRIYNAKYQDCQYCQNARQAVAVQHGLNEDMVSALGHFETSNLPEQIKAALRITSALATNPALLTDEIWADAGAYYSEQELVTSPAVDAHHSEQDHHHAGPRPRQGSQLPIVLPDRDRLLRDIRGPVRSHRRPREPGHYCPAAGGSAHLSPAAREARTEPHSGRDRRTACCRIDLDH